METKISEAVNVLKKLLSDGFPEPDTLYITEKTCEYRYHTDNGVICYLREKFYLDRYGDGFDLSLEEAKKLIEGG